MLSPEQTDRDLPTRLFDTVRARFLLAEGEQGEYPIQTITVDGSSWGISVMPFSTEGYSTEDDLLTDRPPTEDEILAGTVAFLFARAGVDMSQLGASAEHAAQHFMLSQARFLNQYDTHQQELPPEQIVASERASFIEYPEANLAFRSICKYFDLM